MSNRWGPPHYVAASERPFEAARRVFERFAGGLRSPASGLAGAEATQRFLAYFALRSEYESGDLASFDRAKLIALRNERTALASGETDALYELWKVAGRPAVAASLPSDSIIKTPFAGEFATHALNHNYELFGTLTAY